MIYNTLIFDLGNVIFQFSFDRSFQYWAKASDKSFEEIKEKFKFDEVFNKFERNEISPAEFRKLISARLEINLSDEEFDKGWCNLYMDVFPGIDELLAHLKNKYRLIALSNTNSIHQKVWKIKYAPTLIHFEKIFSSHELLCRKPEPEIYITVLEHLKIEPGHAIFLDDMPENVAGAAAVGMKTILVRTPAQMKAELEEWLK